MSTPSTHPEPRRLADYRAGRLSAPAALDLSDHLAACPACRAALSATARADAADCRIDLPAIPPDAPPDYEEMAALLDGTLDATQSADARARLATSPEAAAAFAGLQRFHDEVAALPPKWHGPEPASTAAGPAAAENLSNPGKLVPFPRWHRLSWAAAAAMALLASGWWLAGGAHRAPAPALWADADLSRLPDGLRRGIERAAQTGTVEPAALPAELRPPPGTLAGSAPPPAAWRQTAPVGIVVREDRPVLRWTPREGATGYVVYLADPEGRGALQRQELPAGTTAWMPPVPLARGAIFDWQVEAWRGNILLDRTPRPPSPEARFEVLGAARDAALVELEHRYPRNALVLGTAYAQAGLEQAAEQQFEALAREYPTSGAAERLRRETAGRLAAGE